MTSGSAEPDPDCRSPRSAIGSSAGLRRPSSVLSPGVFPATRLSARQRVLNGGRRYTSESARPALRRSSVAANCSPSDRRPRSPPHQNDTHAGITQPDKHQAWDHFGQSLVRMAAMNQSVHSNEVLGNRNCQDLCWFSMHYLDAPLFEIQLFFIPEIHMI